MILENIDIDIDMVILENIDIDIDKAILQNIDIDKISNRLEFGISNSPRHTPEKCCRFCLEMLFDHDRESQLCPS